MISTESSNRTCEVGGSYHLRHLSYLNNPKSAAFSQEFRTFAAANQSCKMSYTPKNTSETNK